MEARIEQSVAYFELQEQLKQASLDSTAQQALTEEIRSLTSQIMSRSAHLSPHRNVIHVVCFWLLMRIYYVRLR